MKKLKKFFVAVICLMIFSSVFVANGKNVYAASGSVTSYSTELKIVGIWIEVEGGTSGWAWLSSNQLQRASWNYDTQGKKWRAHIGVGGDPQNWLYKVYTPWTTSTSDGLSLEVYWAYGYRWAAIN